MPLDADRLRGTELFAGLPDEDLRWLATAGEERILAGGEVLFSDGDPADTFYVLLDGELLFTAVRGGREQLLTRHTRRKTDPVAPDKTVTAGGDAAPPDADHDGKPPAAHHFTGEMPLLCGTGYVATATAVGRTVLAAYRKPAFLEMLTRFPQVGAVMLPVLAWRIHLVEIQARRTAVLEALGTLAAGLAHELNNPTAALVRSASALSTLLPELSGGAASWGALATPDERTLLTNLVDAATTEPSRVRDALELADATDELADWLTGHLTAPPPLSPPSSPAGVPTAGAEELAEELADHGIGPDRLEELAAGVRPAVLPAALDHLARLLAARRLAGEVGTAGARIADLVAATKAYTDVDRAPVRDIDVVDGLEATLTILAAKLRAVTLRREYAPGLPRVCVRPSELNQVWTNLIDNAVDAMTDAPGLAERRLTVATRREGRWVVVEVRDTGPGIPEELRPRLFQPFFTTKDVGRGTGLGLHLAREIVEERHGGCLDVVSRPGDTRFSVRLPLDGASQPSTPSSSSSSSREWTR
jgi:signal transduction histidine kinase